MRKLFSRSRRRPDRRRKKRDRGRYFLPFILVLLLALLCGGYHLFSLFTEIGEPTTEIGEPVPEEEEPVPPSEKEKPTEIVLVGSPPGIGELVPPAEGEEPPPSGGPPGGPVITEPIDLELIDSIANTSSGDAGHWGEAANGEDPNKYYIDFGNLVIGRYQTMYVGNCSDEVFTLQNNSGTQLTLTIDGVSGRNDLVYTFMWCVDGGGIATLWTIDNDANTGNGSGVIPAGKRATVCIAVKTSGADPSTGTFAPGEWTIHARGE